jgi:hypothetical protein
VLESRLVSGVTTSNQSWVSLVLAVKKCHHSNTLKEAATMVRDPRKTWQYFAQAVIQEEDPEKLTYLMRQLYRALKDNGERVTRTF